jgi:hypothetical protein
VSIKSKKKVFFLKVKNISKNISKKFQNIPIYFKVILNNLRFFGLYMTVNPASLVLEDWY